jgi:hypothetical protein
MVTPDLLVAGRVRGRDEVCVNTKAIWPAGSFQGFQVVNFFQPPLANCHHSDQKPSRCHPLSGRALAPGLV